MLNSLRKFVVCGALSTLILSPSSASAASSYGAAKFNCPAVSGNSAERLCFFPLVPTGSTLEIQYVSWSCDVTDNSGVEVGWAATIAKFETTPENATTPISYSLNQQVGNAAFGAHVSPRNAGWSGASLFAKAGSAPRLRLKIITLIGSLPSPLNVSCSTSLSGMLSP